MKQANIDMHAQAEDSSWESLPYEVASAFVKTLVFHCHKLCEADQKLEQLLASDPDANKKKTQTAKAEQQALRLSKRWIVLNPKTGQLATQAWLQKYLKNGPDDKPMLKDPKSRVKPWIMIFHFLFADGDAELHLQKDPDKPRQRIRCVDLRGGASRASLAFFMQGYEHLLREDEEEQDQEDEGYQSEGTMIDEEEGLEGMQHQNSIWCVHVSCFIRGHCTFFAVFVFKVNPKSSPEMNSMSMLVGRSMGMSCPCLFRAGLERAGVMDEVAGRDPAPEPAAGARKHKQIFRSLRGRLQDDDDDDGENGELDEDQEKDEPEFEQMKVVKADPQSQFRAPPSFMNRECYKELEALNLVSLPPLDGAVLSYHNSSTQWHAHYGDLNYAPMWGSVRSEMMAILLALEKLWEWYKKEKPSDKMADKQLAALGNKIKETPRWEKSMSMLVHLLCHLVWFKKLSMLLLQYYCKILQVYCTYCLLYCTILYRIYCVYNINDGMVTEKVLPRKKGRVQYEPKTSHLGKAAKESGAGVDKSLT